MSNDKRLTDREVKAGWTQLEKIFGCVKDLNALRNDHLKSRGRNQNIPFTTVEEVIEYLESRLGYFEKLFNDEDYFRNVSEEKAESLRTKTLVRINLVEKTIARIKGEEYP